MTVQQLLIRYLLDPLAKLTSRFSQKVKDAGFVFFFLCIMALYWGRGSGLLSFRYVLFFAFGCLCLGGMLLCTLPARMNPVSFRKCLLWIWLGIGALMFLSAILFNINSLPEALLFLFAYPIVFLVWNQSDCSRIFKLLLRGIEISFWLYTLICLLFFPVSSVRYCGLFTNVNGTAGYLALVAVCLLADCLWFEKITVGRIRKLVAFGICTALLLYAGSRTGLLELAAASFVAVIVGFIRLHKQRKLYFFRNILLIAASAFLLFYAALPVLQLGYNAKNSIVTFVQSIFAETPNPDEPIEPTSPSTPSSPSIRPEDSADLLGDRFDTSDKDLNHFSTGRLQIWSEYAKQLNLFGHPDSGSVTFLYNGTEKTYNTTHMTLLQIAYENGIFTGILYLLLNLTAGIYSLIYALRHKGNPYAMLPLLISVAYCVYSLLASTGISFWYICTLMYYLVQAPIMANPQLPEKTEETQVGAK